MVDHKCNDFRKACEEGTIVPEYDKTGNYVEFIITRLGSKLPIPKPIGYEIILINQYDFHEGYGEKLKISYCPFCGQCLSLTDDDDDSDWITAKVPK